MKKKIVLLVIIISIVMLLAISIVFIFRKDESVDDAKNKDVLGVWWWNDKLDTDLYLTFAKENGVNEIYYCSSEFGEETSAFINSANQLGMKVYWLQGEYEWLDDSTSLLNKIEKYRKYQMDYPNTKFSGIHLDIEPHQNPDFKSRREDLILKLVELADLLNKTYEDISFDYDIPFWFDDNISFNNLSRPAYKHIIDIADRVFVMSYRDSMESIIDIASEELDYAQSLGKKLILSVECSSNEGDKVSFAEEGRSLLQEELGKIKKMYNDSVGFAIHHIKSLYDMKE